METISDPERVSAYPPGRTRPNSSATSTDLNRELNLLEQIEMDPDITQATLADRLDVAVGTVNWHLKRLVSKGYVKVKRAQRRKLRYIITPEGIALRARLTVNYIETSLNLYRRIRLRVHELLAQVKGAGFDSVMIEGEGDIADICRLTCLEQGVRIIPVSGKLTGDVPVLEVRGAKVFLSDLPIRSDASIRKM
jgi:DNA-binding MarR family transcriptional regulator